uniref:Malectin-like domain-containing protein n=1 Tax=Salix viminalis TaxID=40686 RepID=A0A6N2NHZ6_SALVM
MISLFPIFSLSASQPPPLRRTLIDCGATVPSTINGLQWILDTGYITSGTSKNLPVPVLYYTLSTVRSFPLQNNIRRKFCYVVNVFRGAKYMIRSTYLYGGINGNDSPPELMEHSSVANTTEDYRDGMSWLEGRLRVSVLLQIRTRNLTGLFRPWSSLELAWLRGTVLSTMNVFDILMIISTGYGSHSEQIIQQYRVVKMCISVPLPNLTYYIALYFAHDHNSLPSGVPYYKNLTVTPAVVVVFATKWPLSGLTAIALTPATGSSIDPLINVGEVFDVIALKNTYKRWYD